MPRQHDIVVDSGDWSSDTSALPAVFKPEVAAQLFRKHWNGRLQCKKPHVVTGLHKHDIHVLYLAKLEGLVTANKKGLFLPTETLIKLRECMQQSNDVDNLGAAVLEETSRRARRGRKGQHHARTR